MKEQVAISTVFLRKSGAHGNPQNKAPRKKGSMGKRLPVGKKSPKDLPEKPA